MIAVLRFFNKVSILLFLPAFLYSYANWLSPVLVAYTPSGNPSLTVDKEVLFYGMMIAFLVVNLAFYFFSRSLRRHPVKSPQATKPGLYASLRTKAIVVGWVLVFQGIINLILMLGAGYLFLINRAEAMQPETAGYILYLMPLLFVAALLLFPLAFLVIPREVDADEVLD